MTNDRDREELIGRLERDDYPVFQDAVLVDGESVRPVPQSDPDRDEQHP